MTTYRAVFLGGPLDGRVENAHVLPHFGEVVIDGVEEPADERAFREEGLPPADERAGFRRWRYTAHRFVDVDGTTFVVYVPDDPADLRGTRPPLTVWAATIARYDYLAELLLMRRERDAADARARAAIQRADGLARQLEDLRRTRSSGVLDARRHTEYGAPGRPAPPNTEESL